MMKLQRMVYFPYYSNPSIQPSFLNTHSRYRDLAFKNDRPTSPHRMYSLWGSEAHLEMERKSGDFLFKETPEKNSSKEYVR